MHHAVAVARAMAQVFTIGLLSPLPKQPQTLRTQKIPRPIKPNYYCAWET